MCLHFLIRFSTFSIFNCGHPFGTPVLHYTVQLASIRRLMHVGQAAPSGFDGLVCRAAAHPWAVYFHHKQIVGPRGAESKPSTFPKPGHGDLQWAARRDARTMRLSSSKGVCVSHASLSSAGFATAAQNKHDSMEIDWLYHGRKAWIRGTRRLPIVP